jgi:hypothetical protein
LKDTSGEHYRIHCPVLAELSGHMRHAGGDTALEGACYLPIGATVETIPNDCFEKWAEVELWPVCREGISVLIGGAACKLLQPNGGLSFERTLAHEAEQGSGGIKEPSR